MALDAGSVVASLGTEIDDRGFVEFDRRLERVDKSSARAKLGAAFEDRGFKLFDRAVADADKAKATARLDADSSALDRKVLDARKRLAELDAVKADPSVDLDRAAFDREYAALRAELKRLDAQKIQIRIDRQGIIGADRDSRGLLQRVRDLNAGGQLLSRTFGLLKWPAYITGVGLAAQGTSALGAGVVALTSALGPLTGLLAGAPALYGALGQGAGVVALAGVSDLTAAVGGLNEKLDKEADAYKNLSPQGQRFARTLDTLKAPLRAVQAVVQRPLFEGMDKGLRAAQGSLGPFRRGMEATATVMGKLSQRAGELIGRKGFGEDLERVMKGNARFMGDLGTAGLNLGNALRFVMVTAQPLVKWMGNLAVKWSENIEGAAKAGEESGRLAAFFERTRETAEQLFRILGNLGTGFRNIGEEAMPLGKSILDYFERITDRFATFTSSVEGRNSIADYFERAREPLFEMFKLIGSIGAAFGRLGTTPGLARLIRQVRTELVPAFENLTEQTTSAFGPVMIDALVQAGRLFGNLAGTSGPLNAFVRLFTGAAKALNDLIDNVPVLGHAIVTVLGGLSISRLLGIGGLRGAISGAVAGGVEDAAAGAAAGGGIRSRMLSFGKRVLGGALALGAITGFAEAFNSRSFAGTSSLEAGVNDWIVGFGQTFGIKLGETSSEAWASKFSSAITAQIRDLGGTIGTLIQDGSGEFIQTAPSIARKQIGALTEFMRREAPEMFDQVWDDATDAERAGLERLAKGINAAGALFERYKIRLPNDFIAGAPEAAASFVRRFTDGLRSLKSGVLSNLGDIQTVFKRNMDLIRNTPGLNGEQAGQALAENFRAAARAITRGMNQGLIPDTKKNMARVEELLRKARLVDATEDQAKRFGASFARGLKQLPRITRGNVNDVIGEIKKMPGPMQSVAAQAMLAQLREYRSKGKLSKDAFADIRSALVTELGVMKDKAESTAPGIFGSILDAANNLLGDLGGVFDSISGQIGELWDSVTSGGGGGGHGGALGGLVGAGGIQRFALGGRARAVAGQDTIRALLRPGEFVVNPVATNAIGAGPMQTLNRAMPGGGVQALVAALTQLLSKQGPAAPAAVAPVVANKTPAIVRSTPKAVAAAPAVRGTVASSGGSSASSGQPRSAPAAGSHVAAQPRNQGFGSAGAVGAVIDASAVQEQTSAAEELRTSISATYDELTAYGSKQAEELRKRVGDHLAYLTENGKKKGQEFADKFGYSLKGIRDTGDKLSGQLRDEVTDNLQRLVTRGNEQFGVLRDRLADRWGDIRARAQKGANDVRTDVTGEFSKLPEKAAQSFGNVGDRAKTALDTLNLAPKATAAFQTPIANAITSAGETVDSKIRAMANAIDSAMQKLDALAAKARSTPTSPGGKGHHNRGGHIPGSGNQDTYAAMLTPNEYVIRSEVVSKLGVGFFDRINSLPTFARGGRVPMAKPKGGKHGGGKHGGHGGKNGKGPKDNPSLAEIAKFLLGDDELAAFGAAGGGEYAGWEDPDTDPLSALMAAYTGEGQTAPVVSSLWVGAYSGLNTLFGNLYSAVGANDPNAAAAAEAAIFGGGGQSVLSGAISALGGIGMAGSSLLGSTDPDASGSAIAQLVAGLWSGYDLRQAGRDALGTRTQGALDRLKETTKKPTQAEKTAIKAKQQQLREIKSKKGRGWQKKAAELKKQIGSMKAKFGDFSPAEAELNDNLKAQLAALPGMGAEDLAGTGDAVSGALAGAASSREGIQSLLDAFGSTSSDRATSDFSAALDAGFAELRNFQSARGSLMKDYGSNFVGGGGVQAQGSARTFGASGETSSGVVESAADGRQISLTQYFSQPPPDPHSWSRSALFEIRSAV